MRDNAGTASDPARQAHNANRAYVLLRFIQTQPASELFIGQADDAIGHIRQAVASAFGPGRSVRGASPVGDVTFLCTDIEGSTRRWEADPDTMRAALAAHDEVLRSAIEAHDGVCAAFGSPN